MPIAYNDYELDYALSNIAVSLAWISAVIIYKIKHFMFFSQLDMVNLVCGVERVGKLLVQIFYVDKKMA